MAGKGQMIDWNGNGILTKFSALTALEVVILTTSSAANDENSSKMPIFSFQCSINDQNFNLNELVWNPYFIEGVNYHVCVCGSEMSVYIEYLPCCSRYHWTNGCCMSLCFKIWALEQGLGQLEKTLPMQRKCYVYNGGVIWYNALFSLAETLFACSETIYRKRAPI